MNTLDDLRATLDSHSDDLGPAALDHATRRAQVQRRIAVARRRRTAVRGTVAAAAVAAVVSAVLVPRLTTDDALDRSVAARTALGDVAPATMRALGLPYEFEMQTATRSGTSVTFEPDAPSSSPRC